MPVGRLARWWVLVDPVSVLFMEGLQGCLPTDGCFCLLRWLSLCSAEEIESAEKGLHRDVDPLRCPIEWVLSNRVPLFPPTVHRFILPVSVLLPSSWQNPLLFSGPPFLRRINLSFV